MATTHDARAAEAFAALRARLEPAQGTSSGRGFGAGALKSQGKIYAALSGGRLLVKLPEPRVDALVGAGQGERMQTGEGRAKREWLLAPLTMIADWEALAREARDFVAAGAPAAGEGKRR